MLCSCQNGVSAKLRLMPATVVFAASLFFCSQPCIGGVSESPVTPEPEGVAGPTNMTVADVVDIRIPLNYAFTDAKGARILLQKDKNPIPQGLCGLIMS